MVYLTRKAEFSASHLYHNPDFTPEENRRVFGKCNNPNGHGHNYTLEVTVKGEVDPRSGFVVDLKQLKEVMHREVLDAMDHRFLNKEVPEFLHQIPTTENIAIAIWQRLATKLTAAELLRLAPPPQRSHEQRRKSDDLRQMQQSFRTRSQLHRRSNRQRPGGREHRNGLQPHRSRLLCRKGSPRPLRPRELEYAPGIRPG